MMQQPTVYSSGSGGQPPMPPPKPPPWKNPYRDGKSQAAQHYDLFEMIRHPYLAKDARPPDPPPQLLSKKERQRRIMEKQVQKQINRGALGFILLAIRFLFWVCLYPFYFVFYVVPSTIYAYLLQIKAAIDAKIHAAKAWITMTYRRAINAIVDPFKKVWKRVKDREKNPHKRDWADDDDLGFFAFIAMGFIYAYTGTIRPLWRGAKRVYNFTRWSVQTIQAIPERIRQAIQTRLNALQSFTHSIKKAMKRRIQTTQAALYLRLIAPPVAVGQKLGALIQHHTAKVSARFEQLAWGIKQTILYPKQVFDKLVQNYQAKKERLTNWFNARLMRIQKGYNDFVKRQKERLNVWLAPIKVRLEQYNAFYQSKVARFYESISKIQKRYNSLRNKLLENIQAKMTRIKNRLPIFKMRIPQWKGLAWTAPQVPWANLKKKVSARLDAIKKHFTELQKPLRTALLAVQTKIAQRWQQFKALFTPFYRFGIAVGYRMRLISVWCRLLFRYGVDQVIR